MILNYFKNTISRITEYVKKRLRSVVTTGVTIVFLVLIISIVISNLRYTPELKTIEIEQGASVQEISQILKDENIIKSASFFKWYWRIFHRSDNIIAGWYNLSVGTGIRQTASMLAEGDFGLDPVRLFIPEGLSINQIANIAEEKLEFFDREEWFSLTDGLEGYLFPDTYLVSPYIKAKDLVKLMRNNFNEQITPLLEEIEEFPYSLHQVLTMASLLELEAFKYEDRQKIAGLLWKRIESDMKLQVDAVFPYIINKNTFEVTLADLKYDSPYNTYLHPGLPPTPIANPGLNAIKATIRPIETPYLFYLSDMQGNIHYTVTHSEHVVNKNKYLR
ncbi:MAG: endolytic transglycosylase MltG [Patescibacteria group bacterium]